MKTTIKSKTVLLFDEYVVVFDPGYVVEAVGLMNAIQACTDLPVKYVISSHL